MNKISNNKLKEIKGGGINLGLAAGISATLSFIIGIIDGWINPIKCNR